MSAFLAAVRPALAGRLVGPAVLAGGLMAIWVPMVHASCQTNTLTPGTFDMSMAFGGTARTFRVHVPQGYTGKRAVPLVLDLHAQGETLGLQQYLSGFAQKSDEAGFIVVWPQGVHASWNGNDCCGGALAENIDDVGFLRALVDHAPLRTSAVRCRRGPSDVLRPACFAGTPPVQ